MGWKALVLSIVAVYVACSLAATLPHPEDPTALGAVNLAAGASSREQRAFPVKHLPPLRYSAKKYTFYKQLVSYYTAWRRCISRGKRLASIESHQDNKAFREALEQSGSFGPFWIAANNLGAKPTKRGQYYWITNDRPVGYLNGFENWLTGNSVDTPAQCVAAYLPSALWITGPCNSNVFYACEESQDV